MINIENKIGLNQSANAQKELNKAIERFGSPKICIIVQDINEESNENIALN